MRAEGVRGTPALQVVGAMAEEGEPEAEPEPEPTELELAAGFPQTPQHIQVKFSEAAAAAGGEGGGGSKTAEKILSTNCWAVNLLDALRNAAGLGPEVALDLASAEDGTLQGLNVKARVETKDEEDNPVVDDEGNPVQVNVYANTLLSPKSTYVLVRIDTDAESGGPTYTALWDEREPQKDEEGNPVLDEDGNPVLEAKEGFPFKVTA